MEDFVDFEDNGFTSACDEQDQDGKKSPFTFPLEALRDIKVDRSAQWLIRGLMPRKGLHILFGAPSTGKSFVALSAAIHIAAGRDWAGRKTFQGDVVYVAAEGGRNFRKRVAAARHELDLPASTPFALITRAPRLGGQADQTAELIEDIKKQCELLHISPRLIVLDTLSRCIADLRESDAADMMRFVDQAQTLSDTFNALVMPVHHSGKDEARGMRGSSSLHASADAEWRVFSDEGGIRRLVVEKMKDGAADADGFAYDLRKVELTKDAEGDPITTCVVDFLDGTAKAAADTSEQSPGKPTQATTTLVGLRMLVSLEGRRVTDAAGIPPGVMAVTVKRAKEVLTTAGLLPNDPPHNADVALRRALKALLAKGLIGREGDFVWLAPAP